MELISEEQTVCNQHRHSSFWDLHLIDKSLKHPALKTSGAHIHRNQGLQGSEGSQSGVEIANHWKRTPPDFPWKAVSPAPTPGWWDICLQVSARYRGTGWCLGQPLSEIFAYFTQRYKTQATWPSQPEQLTCFSTSFSRPSGIKFTISYIQMEHGPGIWVVQIKDRKFLTGSHRWIYKYNPPKLL